MRLILSFFIIIFVIWFNFQDALAKPKHKRKSHAAYAFTVQGNSHLIYEINKAIAEAGQNADISLYIKSLNRGQTLYSRNIYQSLKPASVQKLFTAEAALLYLGPNYRFPTQMLTDAKTISNGVLQGNLYIVLNGDPTLTYSDIVDLLINLKTQRIQAISGNVYIDDTAYDKSFYGPGWVFKDRSYCYAAPIGASIINHNCISLKLLPAKIPGRYAQVVTSPNYFYPVIRNSVITKASKRACNFHLTANPASSLLLEGCVPKGQADLGVSYVVTDIQDYNRALFKASLSRLGVNVYGQVTFGTAPVNAGLIATHASAPLKDLVSEMLKKSDNVIAGAVFKKLGQLYTHQRGSWETGSVAVVQILSRHARVNSLGMRIVDGSGLSVHNLTTAAQLMQVLDFAYRHNGTSYEFISALPISGKDGTLKNRMSNIAGKVRAKTGTMSGVVSLAGYVTSANKDPIAFVIMVNSRAGLGWRYKEMEDKILTILTRYSA